MPDRAHVHGRGPPAEDARDDHGRRPRGPARGAAPSCCRSSRRTSIGIFEAMEGLPVTIRLLDPPLHEFLPEPARAARAQRRARADRARRGRPRRARAAARRGSRRSTRSNPMLGTRGCRLGILYPGDLRDAGPRDHARGQARSTQPPHPEIMIPLVAYEHELEMMRDAGRVACGDEHGMREREDYTVGTMIELPRACFIADQIAAPRRLLLVRDQRPDPDRARASPATTSSRSSCPSTSSDKIIDRSPFETIDAPGRRLAGAAGGVGRARGAPGAEARDLRRARRRPGLDRVLPQGRARLRVLLAVPRPDRADRGRPGGDRARRLVGASLRSASMGRWGWVRGIQFPRPDGVDGPTDAAAGGPSPR